MKKTIRFLFLASFCGGFAFLPATSLRAQEHSWYFKGDIGGDVTVDTQLKEYFGSVAPGSTISFDPGIRLGLAAGYFFTDWFALEGQIGFMANNISSITGADNVDAVYSQAPFLINARFQAPSSWVVAPYLGGGGGGSISTIDANNIDLNGTQFTGWMSTVVYAYQAYGGLRFRINEAMGLSVEYRYFVAGPSSWQADSTSGTDTEHMRIGSTQSHIVSLAFDWRF